MGFERFKNIKCDFALGDKRKPSDKQISFIRAIEEVLQIGFEGETFQEASDFISANSRDFYKSKKEFEANASDKPYKSW